MCAVGVKYMVAAAVARDDRPGWRHKAEASRPRDAIRSQIEALSLRRGIPHRRNVGTVRVGVSRCDFDGILTMPGQTRRAPDLSDLATLAEIV